MERLTEKTIGCFDYQLKDHKPTPGEFGTYDAFFNYSKAVQLLGKYEDTGMIPEEAIQWRNDAIEVTAKLGEEKIEIAKFAAGKGSVSE